MTITRADVESLLIAPWRTPSERTIAELAHTWLAVDDAPSGETVSFLGNNAGRVTFEASGYIPAGIYKLVCIDTPTGGREGS